MEKELELIVADASVELKWQLDDEDRIPQATALNLGKSEPLFHKARPRGNGNASREANQTERI